jgi:hypothetical protein
MASKRRIASNSISVKAGLSMSDSRADRMAVLWASVGGVEVEGCGGVESPFTDGLGVDGRPPEQEAAAEEVSFATLPATWLTCNT